LIRARFCRQLPDGWGDDRANEFVCSSNISVRPENLPGRYVNVM
jgi:hypothetical protein